MSSLAHSHGASSNFEADQVNYTSSVLHLFIEALERRQKAQVLDLGPVCGENIDFFVRRVQRLYVCDMFTAGVVDLVGLEVGASPVTMR